MNVSDSLKDPSTALRTLSPICSKYRRCSMSGWDIEESPVFDAFGRLRQYNSQINKASDQQQPAKIQRQLLRTDRTGVFARLVSRRQSPTRSVKRPNLQPIRMSSSREAKASPRLLNYAMVPPGKARSGRASPLSTLITIDSKRNIQPCAKQQSSRCFEEYAYSYNMKMLLETALNFNTLSGDAHGSYMPTFNTTRLKIRGSSHSSEPRSNHSHR